MDYREKVKEAYSGGGEITRAEHAGEYGMEFILTKRLIDSYIAKDKKVIEIGCGGGYYGIHYADACELYVGVDLSPVNVEVFQKQIDENNLANVSVQEGDATNLVNIKDETFDLVLCLGPLYHLNQKDRQQCIRECERICKKGGIIFFAFINKVGVLAKFSNTVGWDYILSEKIDDCVLTRGTDDIHTDIFFYTMPEEIIADAKAAHLTKVRLAGVDFLAVEDDINNWSNEQKKVWMHVADLIFESEYATALCNHAVLICQK